MGIAQSAASRVEAVSVGELVRRRTGVSEDPWQLALVQRSEVWDEVRMARLLDSLLAGYPIGGLLVCRVRQGGTVLVETPDGREARPADDSASQLIDGQQRVNALVSLFSDAGDFGRFFLDMAAPRTGDEIVTRRRDKRTTVRYIRWSADGQFDDGAGTEGRDRFLDLSCLGGWADRAGDAGIEDALAGIANEPANCLDILSRIDPGFSADLESHALLVAAERTRRLLELWQTDGIPVQHLVLDEPSDVLQVFTRINLEGVRVAGDDIFFAGVKTRWPGAEVAMHRMAKQIPILSRMSALRMLSRIASLQAGQGDLLPLRVDRLNGDEGQRIIEALERLVIPGPELDRMVALCDELTTESGLGHGLRLIDDQLYDHVFAWAAVNPAAEDRAWLRRSLTSVSSYLVGGTAFRYVSILRDTFSRLALREALAAGHAGEPFPLDRILAASRRQWTDLRVGQRAVNAGQLEVNGNAALFLSILQKIPFVLPPGRSVEWDHIYAQALASRMRWRGRHGKERLQIHPKRGFVWHGANLWALDGALNLAASDLSPSAKFDFLAGLPSPDARLQKVWPSERCMTDDEQALVLKAERAIWKDEIDTGMGYFQAFVEGRAERIRAEILERLPKVVSFARDSDVDPYRFDDRPIPAGVIRTPLVVALVPEALPLSEAADALDVGLLSTDEMRAIALEFLREADPDRGTGVHYYEIYHAMEKVGRVAIGDGAPRVHGVLSNAPNLFRSLLEGRFTWVERPEAGRRHWVMRSDRGNRPRLWAELASGRLRQGWGWADDQDIRLLQAVARSGGTWTETQQAASRNRRMLDTEPNSIQIGDLVLVPHMPAEGRWTLAKVIGPYQYGTAEGWADYRHILPVELLSGAAGVDPNRPSITRQLRASLKNQNRMWNIDPVGLDVEQLADSLHEPRPQAST